MKKIKAILAILSVAALIGAGGCSNGNSNCPNGPRGVHEYLDWQITDPATCQKAGKRERACKYCSETQTDVIPKTDHLLTNYTAESSAHWKECSYCHQRFEMGSHTYNGDVCSVCGYDARGTSGLVFRLSSDQRYYSVVSVSGAMPTQVTIPENYCFLPVRSIAENVFNDCPLVETISIPKGVTEIGSGAFAGCTSLKSITVDPANAAFASEAGILYKADKTAIVHIPAKVSGEIVLPSGIRQIDNGAFMGRSVTRVTLPRGLTSIGMKAFADCTLLEEMEVPDTVTKIEKGVFSGCTSLGRLVLPCMWQDGLIEPSVAEGDRWIGNSFIGSLFGADLYASTSYQVPASLKEVQFTGGDILGKYCFLNCRNLERVILPASLRTVEASAFEECSRLSEVHFEEGVETISSNAFKNCSSLSSFTIPASVTRFEANALSGCTSLQSVTVKQGNTHYVGQDGILYDYNKTTIMVIPEKISGSISIPEGITSLSDRAFRGSGITSVSLPSSLTRIGESCFENCAQLKTVTIPAASVLESFGNFCFANCSLLERIDIPASVTRIGQAAFAQSGIRAIYFADPENWGYSLSPDGSGRTAEAPSTLGDPEKAAQRLTDGAYSYRYWTKV